MKQTLSKILIFIAMLLNLSQSTMAVNVDDLIPKAGGSQGNQAEFNKANKNLEKYPEVGQVARLPKLTEMSIITEVIRLILGWSMLITLVAIIVAAMYYLIARGKEEDITKAKDILVYLLIGMAIMAAAYGIVVGIAQFEFFDTAVE